MRKCLVIVLFLFCLSLASQGQDTTSRIRHSWPGAMIAPALLVTAAAISNPYKDEIRTVRNAWNANFHTSVDDYLQYAPIALAYGLNWVGIKGKHDRINRTVMLIKSELLMTCIVEPLKYSTHVIRPDGKNHLSFPSGHTAQAFVAAAFLQKEYGGKSIWYTIGGYTAATAVGALRVLNNKHWISDVLAGAGIGMLSTNLIYITHQYRWGPRNKKIQAVLMPGYDNGPRFYLCLSHL